MATEQNIEARTAWSPRLPWLVVALVVGVLAAVIARATWQVRTSFRQQLMDRDGEVLHAVALLYYSEDAAEGLSLAADADQMSVALKSAQLRGVLGVRLFNEDGRFVESFPFEVMEAVLATDALPKLRKLRPVSRFFPDLEMFRLFYPDDALDPETRIPVLEVNVPLHKAGGPLEGIAQFLVEGNSLAAEFARLDRRLLFQASTAFLAGSAILAAALFWAFRRLQRAQRLLSAQTINLVRANQELALAAKTSALGTVTAHLLHGLKNPLAGLQSFVSAQSVATTTAENSAWQQAVNSTRRMQEMVNQVVGVLREDHTGASYEVTLAELGELVGRRIQPLAREGGIGFTTLIGADGAMPNRTANLVALILINLTENAVQATPPGHKVTLSIRREGDGLKCEVRDEGGGFPADTPLFMPCRSSKANGTGIGLALCKQLANHLGAELELTTSTPAGCVFALKVPLTAPTRLRHKSQVTD